MPRIRQPKRRNNRLVKTPHVLNWKSLTAVLVFMIGVAGYLAVTRSHAATNCTVDDKLVNSCRPWLGIWANNYPNIGSWPTQIAYHEQRLGRQGDVIHTYHATGTLSFNSNEQAWINRPGTYLFPTWRVSDPWSEAGGGNATVNAQIKQSADNIKALGNHQVFLSIMHEPENDVTKATTSCAVANPGSGTTADYVNMWHNVRQIFDQEGVTNVTWVFIQMGFSNYYCMQKDLWPGNNYVDWVMWDPYASGSRTFTSTVTTFYDWMTANSDATHDYLSKPWGLSEFGVYNMTTDQRHAYYDDAKNAILTNRFPKIKMYTIFDSIGTLGDHRVDYDADGNVDSVMQAKYNAFAGAILDQTSGGGSTPTPTPTPQPSTPGDVNGDGQVNVTDLSTILSHWASSYAPADLNHDNIVNVIDLSIVLSHWSG